MKLLLRNRQCDVPGPDVDSYAVEVANLVTSLSDIEVHAWRTLYGAPLGSYGWSARVESMVHLDEVGAKLFTEPKYLELAKSGNDMFSSPAEDHLLDAVAAAGPVETVGSVASIITTRCAAGRIAEAMQWGAEMTTHAFEVTGLGSVFNRSLYGPFAGVGWIMSADSLEAMEEARTALGADATYLERLDAAGDLFASEASAQTLSVRLN